MDFSSWIDRISSEQVLLLSQISCANWSLKDSDIDRIEPLLVTFCSLYSVSLVPLHDDEFFCGPPSTAFLTKEISEMVRTLRDVCLGIVRFMYPDKKVAATINPNSHESDEGEAKVLRMNKQAETIRQRASKFSWLFKVNRKEKKRKSMFVFDRRRSSFNCYNNYVHVMFVDDFVHRIIG